MHEDGVKSMLILAETLAVLSSLVVPINLVAPWLLHIPTVTGLFWFFLLICFVGSLVAPMRDSKYRRIFNRYKIYDLRRRFQALDLMLLSVRHTPTRVIVMLAAAPGIELVIILGLSLLAPLEGAFRDMVMLGLIGGAIGLYCAYCAAIFYSTMRVVQHNERGR